MEDKYIACVVLHSLGDTIGFKNGEWEFNFFKKIEDDSLEILFDFISLGGINNINLKDWYVSDDTFLNHAIIEALILSNKNNIYDLTGKKLVEKLDSMYNLYEEKGINRYAGNVSINMIESIKKYKKDGRDLPYNPLSGGSGCAMRTLGIGMAYFGLENRKQLIEIAINTSRMTHNSPIGYLGGLATALFCAFAVETIHPHKWPFLLMDILENQQVKEYITSDEEQLDYELFLKYWRRYIDLRFNNRKLIKTKAYNNLIYRTLNYQTKFTPSADNILLISGEIEKGEVFGSTGYSAPIVAYDCLIDAENNWEKLVIYSMLNIGDSDTIGSIAGGLYGLLYGMDNVPKNNLQHLELKEHSTKLGSLLYSKYYKNESIPDKLLKKL